MIQIKTSNCASVSEGLQRASNNNCDAKINIKDTYTKSGAPSANPPLSVEQMMRKMCLWSAGTKRPLSDDEIKKVMALIKNMPSEHITVLYKANEKIYIVDPDDPNIPILKDDKGNPVYDADGKIIKCPEGGWPGGVKMNWNCGAYYWGVKSNDGDKLIAFPKSKLESPGIFDKTGDSLAMVHEMGHALDDLSTPDVNASGWKAWSDRLNEAELKELKNICRASFEKGNWWAKSHLGGPLADRSTGEYIANGFMMLYSNDAKRKEIEKNDSALIDYIRRIEREIKKIS